MRIVLLQKKRTFLSCALRTGSLLLDIPDGKLRMRKFIYSIQKGAFQASQSCYGVNTILKVSMALFSKKIILGRPNIWIGSSLLVE